MTPSVQAPPPASGAWFGRLSRRHPLVTLHKRVPSRGRCAAGSVKVAPLRAGLAPREEVVEHANSEKVSLGHKPLGNGRETWAPYFSEDGEMHMRWDRGLAGRQPTDLAPEELRRLVEAGMPLNQRLRLWPRWFAAEPAVDTEVSIIEELMHRVPQDVAHQIDLDVPRTLPRWLGQAEQRSLRRLLYAYSALDPVEGYCQGINNIAAVFVLLGFDEATALHGLCSLLRACCPGYHDRGLRGYLRDAAVMGALAKKVLPPEACRRLDSLGVPLDVLAAGHLLSLTSGLWPFTATVRLWDLFLLEGSPAVFASFLALLQLYLPCPAELAAAARAGENAMPGSVVEEPELAVTFKAAVQRGVTEDLPRVLRQIRALIPKIPMGLIDHLRGSHGPGGGGAVVRRPAERGEHKQAL